MLAPTTEPGTGRTRGTPAVLGVLTVVLAAAYAAYSLIRFWTFRTTTYDLVIFDQAVRSYSRFHLPVALAKGVHNGFGPHFNVLGDHFSPILALLAPLYWIYDGPQTLLVAQGTLLALAVLPLWAYARRRLGTPAASCVIAVYALAWPVAATLAFDFHELAFVPVLSMLMLERHDAGRRWQYAAAAGALLLVKEDMGLLVAGFGLYLLTRPGERRQGAVFVAAGVFWTWLAARVLVPAFGGSADYYWAYDALGRDLPHAAAHALIHPWSALKLMVTPHVKATTMLWLVAPLLLLPLASPITLSVLPLIAERMLASRFGHWWEPRFHYNVALIALLVAASVDGATRLARLARLVSDRPQRSEASERSKRAWGSERAEGFESAEGSKRAWGSERAGGSERAEGAERAERSEGSERSAGRGSRFDRIWPAAALTATLAVLPNFAFKRIFEPGFYRQDARARAAAAVLPAVPDGVIVEAVNTVGPRLSGRTRVLLWDDRPRWAPWVVADTARMTFPFPSAAVQRDRVSLLLRSGYSIVRRQGEFVVLTRPGSVPDLGAVR